MGYCRYCLGLVLFSLVQFALHPSREKCAVYAALKYRYLLSECYFNF